MRVLARVMDPALYYALMLAAELYGDADLRELAEALRADPKEPPEILTRVELPTLARAGWSCRRMEALATSTRRPELVTEAQTLGDRCERLARVLSSVPAKRVNQLPADRVRRAWAIDSPT